MSKKILTPEVIEQIETLLQKGGVSNRDVAREVLGSPSKESTIRAGIARGDIVVGGVDVVKEDDLSPEQLDILCEHQDFSVSNLAKRLRSAQRSNNQLRRIQREVFDDEGENVSLEDLMVKVFNNLNLNPINYSQILPDQEAVPATLEVMLSDLQIGKITRHFNKDSALKGLKAYGEGILKEIFQKRDKFKLERVVLELLGDLTEDHIKHGVGSAISTDCGLSEQMVLATQGIWDYILQPLASQGVEVEVVCVVGNHGSSTHKGMGTFKEGKYSYDYTIFKMLEQFSKMSGFDNVKFNIPEGTFGHTTIYGKHVILEHGYHNNITEKGMIDQMRKRGAQLKVHPTYWRQADRHHHITYGQGEQILNGAFFGVDSEGLEYSGILGFTSIPSQTLVWHTDEKSIGKGTVKDVVNIQVFVDEKA